MNLSRLCDYRARRAALLDRCRGLSRFGFPDLILRDNARQAMADLRLRYRDVFPVLTF